jgi:hypothetical protein
MANALWVYSIYGAETRKGLVKLVKDKEIIATVSPEEARSWALNILEAAESAQTDEFLIYLLTEKIGLDLAKAGSVLQEFREYREKHQE